jgi:hypothetical protein
MVSFSSFSHVSCIPSSQPHARFPYSNSHSSTEMRFSWNAVFYRKKKKKRWGGTIPHTHNSFLGWINIYTNYNEEKSERNLDRTTLNFQPLRNFLTISENFKMFPLNLNCELIKGSRPLFDKGSIEGNWKRTPLGSLVIPWIIGSFCGPSRDSYAPHSLSVRWISK